jgi:APA family basic amino acid/polyamine antiporter
VYAERAFGKRVGFLVGWTDWLAHCIGLAWVATTVGEYGQALLPAAIPQGPYTARILALLAIGLFSLIQLRGLRAGSASQEFLSLAKAVAFLALVAACFLLPIQAAPPIAPPVPAPIAIAGWRSLSLAVVLALQAVITTYDGWASPVYFAEEFSEPGRDLPRSLIGGVLAVLVLYLLINLALLHVLPIAQLASSNLPAAAAARALAGPLGGLLITALALVSLLGLINTVVMAAPRILFGLSRDGLLPSFVAQVNGGGTPSAALLLTSTAAAALVLAGSFERLLTMGAVLYVSLPLAGIASLVTLRQREPELPRPFLTWGYPVSPLLITAVSLAFLMGSTANDWLSSLAAIALVATGYGVCLLAERRPLADATS